MITLLKKWMKLFLKLLSKIKDYGQFRYKIDVSMIEDDVYLCELIKRICFLYSNKRFFNKG